MHTDATHTTEEEKVNSHGAHRRWKRSQRPRLTGVSFRPSLIKKTPCAQRFACQRRQRFIPRRELKTRSKVAPVSDRKERSSALALLLLSHAFMPIKEHPLLCKTLKLLSVNFYPLFLDVRKRSLRYRAWKTLNCWTLTSNDNQRMSNGSVEPKSNLFICSVCESKSKT